MSKLHLITLKNKHTELLIFVNIVDSVIRDTKGFNSNYKSYVVTKIINNYNIKHPFAPNGIYSIGYVDDWSKLNNYFFNIKQYYTAEEILNL
jgi:hypothetical protein